MADFGLFAFPGADHYCQSNYYRNYQFFSNGVANPNLTGNNAILSDDDGNLICSYNYLCPYSILGVYNGGDIIYDTSYIRHEIFNNDELIVSGNHVYGSKSGFQGQVEFFPNFSSPNTRISVIVSDMFWARDLVSIRMPYNTQDGVDVEREAFGSCTSLRYIYCYNVIKYVGKGAFSGCSSLVGSEIACGNYMGCVAGDSYPLKDSNHIDTLKICFDCGDDSFRWCTSLKKVEFYNANSSYNGLPYPITETYFHKFKIGKNAFEGCTSLWYINGYSCSRTSYYISDSTYDIFIPKKLDLSGADNCFANCTSLNGTVFFENLSENEKIPAGLFSGCTGITYASTYNNTSIKFPDASNNYIGDGAFANTGIPVDKREEVLENLVVDTESIPSEITRIFGS